MVWYFIDVYKMNRTLHGRLEIRNFFSCVEEFEEGKGFVKEKDGDNIRKVLCKSFIQWF